MLVLSLLNLFLWI